MGMAAKPTVKHLTIGEVAKATGVSADTLRYYEKMGLIRPSGRSTGGYRLYGVEATRIIRFIRGAKSLNFSLDEIRELLALNASDQATCQQMLVRTKEKLAQAEQKIRELKAIKTLLSDLATRCPGDASPTDGCPIMQHIQSGGGVRKGRIVAALAAFLGVMQMAPQPAHAKPVSYVGGTMLMQENDETGYSGSVDYTFDPRASVGAYVKRERGEPDGENYTTAGPQLNLLLKRWNLPEGQGNIFSTTGAGVTTLDGHSQFAAWTGILADYETRRFFSSYEARYISAGDIDHAFSQRARLGIAPYKGNYDDVQPWFMVQVDNHPTKVDNFVVTPLVRVFYQTNLIEAGYSSNHNVMVNWVKQF